MRLCVYKDSLSVGRGADKAVKAFAAAMSDRGHDVALVERGGLAAALDEPWEAIVATGPNEALDLDRAGYLGRPARSPVVLQLHVAPHGFFKWRHPLRNLAIRRAFRRADAAQLLCSDYVEEFRRIAPGVRTRVIGNYTEIAPPPDSGLSTFDFRRKTILYPAAILSRRKNQGFLIESFSKVAGEFPGWRLRLLGRDDTGYAESCRALVKKLGLSERVEFVGLTDDLVGEYSGASFVACPSTLEGFPLIVLEAAAFGLPVVALKMLPGVRDFVHDGETGLLAGDDASGYSKTLSRMMADESFCRRLGERARDRCDKEYSKERVLGEWESFLKEVTGK